jgi:5-methyltetrahydrofolate--homocysteine methyltransferase
MTDWTILNRMVIEGRHEAARLMTEQALAEGHAAPEILERGLLAGMRVVGEDFRRNRIFVPQVLLAARAMKAGMSVLKPLLAAGEGGAARSPVIVLGTVKGDVHDIGKALVGMIAEGAGFSVVDLGTDTSAERYLEAAKRHDADILAMSALLTTTMAYMRTVVQEARRAGLRAKICVGGAPLSAEYAREIGADGYAADATSAARLFERLVGGAVGARPRAPFGPEGR